MRRLSQPFLPLLGILLVTACGILGIGDDGQGIRDHATLVATVQGVGIVRINARNGDVMAAYRVGSRDGYYDVIERAVNVPLEGAVLGVSQDPEPSVVYFSMRAFRLVWQEAATTLRARSAGVSDIEFSHAAPLPSGREVVHYWIEDDAGRPRLGVFDPESKTARALHAGELHSRAVGVLRPGGVGPGGAVVSFASREGNPRTHPAHLWVIDPEGGGILDSIPEAELPAVGDHGLMWAGVDDRHVFFAGGQGLVAYDVVARKAARVLPLEGAFRELVVDPWSDRFMLYDFGGLNYPGSGLIHLFDGDFNRTVIDLVEQAAHEPGEAPSVRGAAFGDDGLIYLLAGTQGAGVSQPIRLVVVDPETAKVVRINYLQIEGNAAGPLFYVPASR